MLKRVMVVVLLGCVGLTAGVAFGTLFSSNQSRPSIVLPAVQTSVLPGVRFSCHQGFQPYSTVNPVANIGNHTTQVSPPTHGERRMHGAPSGGLPMSGYVLFGLLAGLSAALGFLVPPTSR